MLANNVEPITPEIRIRNQAGKEVQVAAAKHYQRLNGQLFEPLGVLDGRVYFKNVRSSKLCSLPVATAGLADASPKPTAAKDEKPGKGQNSKDEKGAAKSDSSRAK